MKKHGFVFCLLWLLVFCFFCFGYARASSSRTIRQNVTTNHPILLSSPYAMTHQDSVTLAQKDSLLNLSSPKKEPVVQGSFGWQDGVAIVYHVGHVCIVVIPIALLMWWWDRRKMKKKA